ncbi:MAG: DUF4870 domain-containing protein [Cyanobacteria bacterium P01_A01_bin.45]
MSELTKEQEKTWGGLCHFSTFSGYIVPFGTILGPLVIWLIYKDKSEYINAQGKEALNFQITIFIAAVVSGILIFILIGFLLLPIIGIAHIVLSIMAGVKAMNGEMYKYPLTIRFLK